MARERALQVVLGLVGLLFVWGIYPLIDGVLHPDVGNMGSTMMLSLYVTLGVFLLIAVRHPQAHRGVISFTVWSSVAHGLTMVAQSVRAVGDRKGLLMAAAVFAVIAILVGVLSPKRRQVANPATVSV
jgi:hypothetical protein